MALPYKIATLLYCFVSATKCFVARTAQEPIAASGARPAASCHTESGDLHSLCACREALEELELKVTPAAICIDCIVSEHGYEGQATGYVPVRDIKPRLSHCPRRIGRTFEFFSRTNCPN